MATNSAEIRVQLHTGEFVLAIRKSTRRLLEASDAFRNLSAVMGGGRVARYQRRESGRRKARADAAIRQARREIVREKSTNPVIRKGI